MCAHLGLGLGENNNGKNILGFGVLGVEHGGMSGEEISFYSSLRGPAAQLGKEENSSLLPRVHSVDLLYQQGAWGTCRVSSTGSESALKQDAPSSSGGTALLGKPFSPPSLPPRPYLQHSPPLPSPLLLFSAILTSQPLISHATMATKLCPVLQGFPQALQELQFSSWKSLKNTSPVP